MPRPIAGLTFSASARRAPSFLDGLPPEARDALFAQVEWEVEEYPVGTVLVREGDEGDRFYLIASGEVEVWAEKDAAASGPRADEPREAWTPDAQRHTLLARLGPGDGFGEMALLLGGPRTATVRALTPVKLYSIDGATFTRVVDRHRGLGVALEEEMALRSVVAFLGRASPFAKLPPEALRWLALRLQQHYFAAGQAIVRQGEPGDAFYIIWAGRAEVLVGRPDGSEQQIATLAAGAPFGEQALLSGEPRSATVRAVEPAQVLRLSRDDFEAVLVQYRDRESYFVQLALQRQRPRRLERCTIERQDGRDGELVYILKDPLRNRYVKLSAQGAFLWTLMDGQHTVRDLTLAYFERYKSFGLDAIMGAMTQLHAAGFLHMQRIGSHRQDEAVGASPRDRLEKLPSSLVARYYSLPDVDRLLAAVYRWARPLYLRPLQALLLLATLAGASLFGKYLFVGGLDLAADEAWERLALTIVGSFTVQGFLHELAHAVTCKHFGRAVHRAGVGWYFFLPTAFVDLSDIWMAGKWPRIAATIAGPYANFVLSGIATLALAFVPDLVWRTTVFQFAVVGYIVGIMDLNPLTEYDGYYVLMDWLGVPNLRAKALAFLGALIWRTGRTGSDRRLAGIFFVYGALALLYTFFVAASVLLGYQHFVQDAVSHVLPPRIAGLLGWIFAGSMVLSIAMRLWSDLRAGARRARPGTA